MASIAKHKGKWCVRWRELDGVTERRRTCSSKEAARDLLRDVEAAQSGGRNWRPVHGVDTPDLQLIFQAFLNDRARVLKPSTMVQRKLALKLYALYLRTVQPRGRFGPELLSKPHLAGFYQYMRDVRKNTVMSAAARVRLVFYCWRWAFDDDRFATTVARPRIIDLPDDGPVLKTAAPTWAQADAAVSEATRVRDWVGRFFTVLRFTGLRKNQVMRLRWEDLDLEAATLRIRPELGKSKQERRGRVIPVSPHLVAAAAGWGVREGFLIDVDTKLGRRAVDNQRLHRIWLATKAPREVWRQPCHAFRKCFVSRLTEAGVSEIVLKVLVGHSRGTTGDVYTEAAAMMPLMRAAVAMIPAVGAGNTVAIGAGRRKSRARVPLASPGAG